MVLLDPMLNQPCNTTVNEQHLSQKVSLDSMQLWYDAQFRVFAPMLHGLANQLLSFLTVFLGRVMVRLLTKTYTLELTWSIIFLISIPSNFRPK